MIWAEMEGSRACGGGLACGFGCVCGRLCAGKGSVGNAVGSWAYLQGDLHPEHMEARLACMFPASCSAVVVYRDRGRGFGCM